MKTPPLPRLAPFFVGSVPKSGTHLLQQIINGIPGASHDMDQWDHKFFKDNFFWQQSVEHHHKLRLAQMKQGQYAIGHVHYIPQYSDLLRQLGFKHIFLYRDPRDVLVSLSYYVADHWKNHPLHNDFNRTELIAKDRMRLLLTGVPNKLPSFMENMAPYYGWIHDPDCLKIRFEDLTASASSRETTIFKIAEYLWKGNTPPVPLDKMVQLAVQNIKPKESHTFRKGTTGQWRLEADDELKALTKKLIGALLVQTGYEKDLSW